MSWTLYEVHGGTWTPSVISNVISREDLAIVVAFDNFQVSVQGRQTIVELLLIVFHRRKIRIILTYDYLDPQMGLEKVYVNFRQING